jgi:hypothetical protein
MVQRMGLRQGVSWQGAVSVMPRISNRSCGETETGQVGAAVLPTGIEPQKRHSMVKGVTVLSCRDGVSFGYTTIDVAHGAGVKPPKRRVVQVPRHCSGTATG